MRQERIEEDSKGKGMQRRKILVLSKGDRFTEEVMDYAVHLAERLDYDIFAVSLGSDWNGLSALDSEALWREGFRRRAEQAAKALGKKAIIRGVHCEHTV